ncbi:hypothetical protein FQN53_004471 [Emmonsiellopsis sp. PD_33]|nr:hypothetical protein FQN53_004471 [Emmonsiellopsis sp. PD_33]
MAAQLAAISDTIISMKRALERKRLAAGVDDPITQPTNRGNKLRQNAQYVHEGALGYTDGEKFYRKVQDVPRFLKVEYAGYKRDILEFNPPKYDSEGDELDGDDDDEHADPEMAEENPFAEVHLEEILGPLRYPSQLADHPSMSQPYTSKTLRQMVENANAKLRQEQVILHKAKRLHRELLGDAPWMPCGFLETMDDRNIFDPRCGFSGQAPSKHGNGRGKSGFSTRSGSATHQTTAPQKSSLPILSNNDVAGSANGTPADLQPGDQDVEMANAEEPLEEKPNKDTTSEPPKMNGQAVSPPASTNGDDVTKPAEAQSPKPPANEEPPDTKKEPNDEAPDNAVTDGNDVNMKDKDTEDIENDVDDGASDTSSPEPPRRMTTRAQANQAANPHHPTSPTSSGTARSHSPLYPDSNDAHLTVHPLFLVPPTHIDRTCGLPPTEADEIRRMLWSYIQKQEETVRASRRMYHMLLGVCRKKELVWEWCKADEHAGELSDGEDWYDPEQWGLKEGEELRKGADEDEAEGVVDEGRATGKRGRGRRA